MLVMSTVLTRHFGFYFIIILCRLCIVDLICHIYCCRWALAAPPIHLFHVSSLRVVVATAPISPAPSVCLDPNHSPSPETFRFETKPRSQNLLLHRIIFSHFKRILFWLRFRFSVLVVKFRHFSRPWSLGALLSKLPGFHTCTLGGWH
jgi:hypothetical protein